MLWYKAWAESRARFLIAALVMTTAAGFVIASHGAPRVMFRGFPRTLFTFFALVLGMGGLVRERDLGTAGFTLGLPVTRRRLTLTRAAVGLAELIPLALVPSVAMAIGSHAGGASYGTATLAFAGRWLVGGAALFALGLLASAAVGGEYTPFVAALVVHFGHTVTTQFVRTARPSAAPYLFTVQDVMGGLRTGVPDLVVMAAAAALVALAVGWTERKDL
jgi:ABC-2 type transport system permease protein